MHLVLFALLAQEPAALQNASLAAQQRAIYLQVMAVRRQAKLPLKPTAAFFVMDPPEPEPDNDFGCDPLAPMRAGKLIDDAAKRTGVSANLIRAVMQQESAFRPCAVSNKGARGLMQLMPATMEHFGVTDGFDPEQNVSAGASLLKELMSRYAGDLNRVLGAYNAGPARVDAVDGVPMIPETMNYVDRILDRLAPRPSP